LLAAASFGIVSLVLPDSNFGLFAALVVLGSFSVTVFDSTTDGLAIDTTPEADRGTVQGTMVGGRAAGFILLSLAFGALVQSQGYRVVFLVIAAIMLLPLLWVLRVREPEEREITRTFHWGAFKEIGKPAFLAFAAYAIVYSIASFGVDGLVTFFMSEHFSAAETAIGQYGAFRGVGAVLGALAGALLIDRLGRRRSAYAAILIISVGAVLIGAAASVSYLLVLGVIWGIAWAFQETVFFSLAMDLADTRIAASMFAIMMAVSNIGTAVGEGVATGLADNIAFSSIFWILAGINLLSLPLLWLLFKLAPKFAHRQSATP
jgi:PAT family beta-lactamase induction signal transducer AmpG